MIAKHNWRTLFHLNQELLPLELFLNNTNLTFLAFFYKIDIKGFQNQQKYSWQAGTKELSGFFMIRRSDRPKVTQNKINFVKNWSQWGLNPQPLDHHSMLCQLSSGGICWRFLKWALVISCTILNFLSRINRAWLYKGLNDSHRYPNSEWLNSVGRALEWWSGGCWFKLHWGKFLMNFFFVLCNLRSVR